MKNNNLVESLLLGLIQFVMTIHFGLLFGCGSKQTVDIANDEGGDRVLARIDQLSQRPNWLKESEPFRIESGNLISLGISTIQGSDRVEAGYRIAQNNAKASIANAIEQRLEFIFQNAEEGSSMNSTQARYIGAEAASLVSNSIRPFKNYWEKLSTLTENGDRMIIYRVFSTVTMPETDFKKAVFEAIRRVQNKGGLSKDFGQKVDAHWNKFTGLQTEQTK